MDLGLTTGSLNVSNLIQPIVRRFNGTINLYSAIWTNFALIPAPDPATPGSFITNTIEIRCHALIVDHAFATRVPVETYRFAAKAPHVVLNDRVSAVEGFVIDSPDIDIRASLDAQANAISATNFPSVINLTNRAQLTTSVALGLEAAPIRFLISRTVEIYPGPRWTSMRHRRSTLARSGVPWGT